MTKLLSETKCYNWQTTNQKSCKGRQGFDDYFNHVTKFRRAVDKLTATLGGKPIIKACDVSHPSIPEIIHTKIEKLAQNYLLKCIDNNSVLDCLKFDEHQPYAIREAFAALLDKRFAKQTVLPQHVLLMYGSSTQWLDTLVRAVVVKSLQHDFAIKNPVRQPVILTPAGSFKCGGYFPYANGGELHYIPTTFKNCYKLTPALLDHEIKKIHTNKHKKVVCILLETPTALGQNYTTTELTDIANVISQYPDILWIQDWYNLGTEHDEYLPNALADNSAIAQQGCTISSFRRDWGGAATYANVSVMQSFNEDLIKEISQQCSETYFYVRPPLQKLQTFITHQIANEMKVSQFTHKNQQFFKQQFDEYKKILLEVNDSLNFELNTEGINYLFTLKAQAGQFGFLFFNKDTTDKGQICNGTQIAELMCVHPDCRVMPTLLSPMGIGEDPVGVRLNICLSEDTTKNQKLIRSILLRIAQLVVAIEKGMISYPSFAPLISLLRNGQEINCRQLNEFGELLCTQPISSITV